MSFYQVATVYPSAVQPDPQEGQLTAGRNVFTDAAGQTWTYRGLTQFLLFYRWLNGEDIDPVMDWCVSTGANVVRVLGMVNWASNGQTFGPGITPNWWPELRPFIDYCAQWGLRVEFVVFASAQDIMPKESDQKAHLQKVVDAIGGCWNVLIEIANEPQQNGCNPPAIWSPSNPRPCPMAYGLYDGTKTQNAQGQWILTIPALSYLTAHTPRDPEAWSRKVKDLSEYRDGSGDGSENAPLLEGLHIAPVGDEPMGAAERNAIGGRQRSCIPQDFFWAVANGAINGAGSTFHCDAGLQSVVPPPEGDQQKCAEASALAWASVEPEYQTGQYTRGGLTSCPLVWEPEKFPEQTSRIYARLLGDRAVAVAIKPNADWLPQAAPGWQIVSAIGPLNSLVHLVRG